MLSKFTTSTKRAYTQVNVSQAPCLHWLCYLRSHLCTTSGSRKKARMRFRAQDAPSSAGSPNEPLHLESHVQGSSLSQSQLVGRWEFGVVVITFVHAHSQQLGGCAQRAGAAAAARLLQLLSVVLIPAKHSASITLAHSLVLLWSWQPPSVGILLRGSRDGRTECSLARGARPPPGVHVVRCSCACVCVRASASRADARLSTDVHEVGLPKRRRLQAALPGTTPAGWVLEGW
jgi:hypothetical protein